MKPVNYSAWHLVTGLIVWAVWFIVVYAGAALGCQWAPPSPAAGALNWINLTLLGVSVLTAGYLGYCAWLSWQMKRSATGHGRFTLSLAAGGYLAASVATMAIALPLLGIPPCM